MAWFEPGTFKVQFHDQTATIDSTGSPSYTEVYMVIAERGTKASDIIANTQPQNVALNVNKVNLALPTYKSKLNNVPVSSINIERWTDGHAKEVAGIEGAAIWKYTVVYSKDRSGRGGYSDKTKAPWELDYAQNCTLSPKTYTERTNKTLRVTSISGAALPFVEQNKRMLTNALGEPVYRDVEVSNQVLSFDYAVKKYDIDTNHLYVGSVNVSDITVAGITIAAGRGKLISLVPSAQIWEEDKEYVQVHVEIELAVYKSVFKDYLIGNSRYAIPSSSNTSSGTTVNPGEVDFETGGQGGTSAVPSSKKIPYPIQMLTCDVKDIAGYEGVLWFNKARKLGYFGEAKKGSTMLSPSLYSYVTEEYPLNKDGTLYIGTKTESGAYIVDMNDPNLNWIETTDSYILSWASLGFPKKGFKDA